MKIGDLFYETWHALSANKGRSFLTILGIVIGIAAVIAMTSLIAGVQNMLMGEMGLSQARQVSISAYSPQGITFDDLDKLDIRVGRIVRVDDVEGSKKLIKMTVSFGGFTRTILSGMKEERADCKAELEGRQALFVVNMAPRKMAGEVSEGMIYDIGYEDGILPALAVPEREVPDGARLG